MSGIGTNKGSQNLFHQYNDPLTSQEFDSKFAGIIPTGIYQGGLLTRIDDNTVQVAPWVIAIGDGVYLITGTSSSAYNVTSVSFSTPFLVLSWDYNNVNAWYVDVKAVSEGAIGDYDLVLGEALYSESVLTGFDYSRRSVAKSFENFCKVVPSSPEAMTLTVKSGWVTYGESKLLVEEQTSPTFTAPSVNPRIDLVYIDSSGVIQIEAGDEEVSPVAPSHIDKVVIAEISLAVGQTVIVAGNINDCRPFLSLGGSGGGMPKYLLSFTSGDLVSEKLAITHGLNSTELYPMLYDNNGKWALPSNFEPLTVDTAELDMTDMTVDGTWKIILLSVADSGSIPGVTVATDLSSPSDTQVPTTLATKTAIKAIEGIEVRTSDPTGVDLYEGRVWIRGDL